MGGPAGKAAAFLAIVLAGMATIVSRPRRREPSEIAAKVPRR
jgi:hypothetical protein